ncbi:phosphoribosyltransferase [Aggregatilinea lenta]|uniref:phosphoribosyltransferase n=1 Tax=Aggregatilinea lenta TaxID=913108 RepID=UPI000E5B7606
MELRFRDRGEAGRMLASRLAVYSGRSDVFILALPRGGVPVAYEVARVLHAPLDVFVVRKLGLPGNSELAFGAIASGDVQVFNDDIVFGASLPDAMIKRVAAREQSELGRREHLYRGDRPYPDLRHKTVILVDDGLATGASMRAAVRAVRQHDPAKVVVAVPTASVQTCDALRGEADEVICAMTPDPFSAVGLWYEDFTQVSDSQVRRLLRQASDAQAGV